MRINLNDVTFLFRLKLDSMDRLENLLMVIEFIDKHFDTNIQVMETAPFDNHILKKLLPKHISINVIEDYDPIYHYTKYMNRMVKNCQTPIVAVWEADVIVPIEQITASVDWIRQEKADFVSPYKEKALDTTRILREIFFKTRDIDILHDNHGKMIELYSPNPVGGGFFADREAYIQAGKENEAFYGWGREDGERIIRWKILGYKYKRVSGPLFHLSHDRGINSRFHSPRQDDMKTSEVFRIYAMSKNELNDEIKGW